MSQTTVTVSQNKTSCDLTRRPTSPRLRSTRCGCRMLQKLLRRVTPSLTSDSHGRCPTTDVHVIPDVVITTSANHVSLPRQPLAGRRRPAEIQTYRMNRAYCTVAVAFRSVFL
ncbi:hypothetical protein NL676_038208 [Syzygium grande]|nr:hypothetical protein NL676_038208 [Syzygium grande]